MTQDHDHHSAATAPFTLLATIFFFSISPLFLKFFTHYLDAWTVNGVRYAFASLFWMPFVVFHMIRVPKDRDIWRHAWAPVGVHLCGQVCWALTPYFNDASILHFVGRISFLFSMLFGFWILHEERALRGHKIFWIATSVIVTGLIVMYVFGLEHGSTTPTGLALLIATATCWGLYGVLVQKFMRRYPARLSFGVISLYTAPFLLLFVSLFGDWTSLSSLEPSVWTLLVVSAFAGIAMGHVALYKTIHALGPIVTEGGLMLVPFVTAMGAYYLLDERMTRMQWIGGVMIVIGSTLLIRLKRNLMVARPAR